MEKLCVETILGTLLAHPQGDTDYPGIGISLMRNGKEILLAVVESNESRPSQAPYITLHGYANCDDDEPTTSQDITAEALDHYFAAVKAGRIELA